MIRLSQSDLITIKREIENCCSSEDPEKLCASSSLWFSPGLPSFCPFSVYQYFKPALLIACTFTILRKKQRKKEEKKTREKWTPEQFGKTIEIKKDNTKIYILNTALSFLVSFAFFVFLSSRVFKSMTVHQLSGAITLIPFGKGKANPQFKSTIPVPTTQNFPPKDTITKRQFSHEQQRGT